MTAADSVSSSKMTKKQSRGRTNSLQPHVVEYLKKWLMSEEHINHPYPTEREKNKLVADTGIDIKRLNNWFVNNRIRYWKPRFEALQKQKQQRERKHKEDSLSTNSISVSIRVEEEEEEETPSLPEGDIPKVTSTNKAFGLEEATNTKSLHLVSPVTPRLNLSHLVQTVMNVVDDDGSSSVNGDANFNLMTFQFHRRRKRQRTKIGNNCLDTAATRSTSTLETPRFKYMHKNVEQWKFACLTSPKSDDRNLPTLDEAVHLFGYSIVTAYS